MGADCSCSELERSPRATRLRRISSRTQLLLQRGPACCGTKKSLATVAVALPFENYQDGAACRPRSICSHVKRR